MCISDQNIGQMELLPQKEALKIEVIVVSLSQPTFTPDETVFIQKTPGPWERTHSALFPDNKSELVCHNLQKFH